MESIFKRLAVTISVPDHTTLSPRATTMPSVSPGRLPDGPLHLLIDSTRLKVYGTGEWLQEKHGVRARRTWRKLHLEVDANSGMIVASTLAEQDVGDPSQVGPLLERVPSDIAQVTADGADDGAPIYWTVESRGQDIVVVIPPRVKAVPDDDAEHVLTQRDGHIAFLCSQRSISLAEGDRLCPPTARRKRAGKVQGDHWPATAGALLGRSTYRGRHRRGGPQPHAGSRTPEIRS